MKKDIKKPTLAEKQKKPSCPELIKRVIEVKERLPKSGVSTLMAFTYEDYNTVKGKSLVSQVLALRKTDKLVTERLEDLAESLKNKDFKLN